MDILLVRHGESEGNAERRMQGHLDLHLSETGRAQARALSNWLARNAIGWDAALTSPLARARQTAELISHSAGLSADLESDLAEIRAGSLEGLTREQMLERFPSFLERPVTDLGDFSEFGGESYDEVQLRARRLLHKLERMYRDPPQRVLLVGHGGINFQLLKILICEPVPRVCILRMGNCSATLVRMRERRGRYLGELVWHIPVELMGAETGEGVTGVFR
jgi:2,3-bisphosphoglycerate-dependent phosphoglycerate mutase